MGGAEGRGPAPDGPRVARPAGAGPAQDTVTCGLTVPRGRGLLRGEGLPSGHALLGGVSGRLSGGRLRRLIAGEHLWTAHTDDLSTD
jgi:hypothetical protein